MSDQDDFVEQVTSESKLKKKIDEIKAQRSSVKGNLTRVKNYIVTNRNTISATELQCRGNIFEQYWRLWLSHQTSFEKLKPDDLNHETARAEVEDLYCEVKGIMALSSPNRASISDGNNSTILPTAVKSNLPSIKLPNFSGKYSEYPNFIAMFNKLVGDDDTLSITEKYNHLRNCLSGPALSTIDTLGTSATNYTIALKTLKERYENNCLIFEEHMAEMFELPKITRNSALQLRNLIDKTSAHLNAMKTIGSDADILNAFMIYLVSTKLDVDSLTKYDEIISYSSTNLPKWSDLCAVLNKRCQLLEVREGKLHKSGQTLNSSNVNTSNNQKSKYKHHSSSSTFVASAVSSNSNNLLCTFCADSNHRIEKCEKFSKLNVLNRFSEVKRLSLCINCLRSGHSVSNCRSTHKCKVCAKSHHTLLHRNETNKPSDLTTVSQSNVPKISNFTQPSSSGISLHVSSLIPCLSANKSTNKILNNDTEKTITPCSFLNQGDQTLLATAVVLIKDISGSYHLARALLDSGSQLNLITDRLVHLLRLKRNSICGSISGIAETITKITSETSSTIKSRFNDYEISVKFWVVPSITNQNHPEKEISKETLKIPSNLNLADPTFFKSKKVDILIGAERFFDLLSVGQIKLASGGPYLQKTTFGWIISGRFQSELKPLPICALSTVEKDEEDINLNKLVEKFWSIETIDHENKWCTNFSLEQKNCELFFRNTITRTNDNRLMVKFPFKKSPNELGTSFEIAKRKFFWLEKRLSKDPEAKRQYSEFLKEYVDLGHMEEVNFHEIPKLHYFIPHQHVVRPDSTTTKFRVVFNASSASTTNISLNDILSVGPTVQQDLFSILLKFRCYPYAITADVVKMYRQIWVHPEDRHFQYIIWRENITDDHKIYRLKTITYGTASAPYLATRCLNYLADESAEHYPNASNIIKNSFYVDDLIAGGDTPQEIEKIRIEISEILNSANLPLRKWYSNEPSFLSNLLPEELEKPIRLDDSDVIKTLGIVWQPFIDKFKFTYRSSADTTSNKITKRTVLSDLAKLYDPLGLINPVVVSAKLFMQELWLLQLSWDESLPQSHHQRWVNFLHSLQELNKISIPRFVLTNNKISRVEIHGFSDASIRAFGCCIYVRSIDANNQITVKLLVAKSKIAPSKKTRTLPVLELFGAELLSKLWVKIKSCYPKPIDEIYFWTDSTIVLGWLKSHASKWQTLVANGVSTIQYLTSDVTWLHVTSKANPADIISRGSSVVDLNNSIWFSGPEFLYKSREYWPHQRELNNSQELPELRTISCRNPQTILLVHHRTTIVNKIYQFSNFQKIRRIFAYVIRFINNLKAKIINQPLNRSILTSEELDNAFMKLIYVIQQHSFELEINHLKKNQPVPQSSNIKSLNPFIDPIDGILKVGGRLRNANIPYDTRYPILLPKNNQFINTYIKFIHFRNCHAGAQALLSIIQQKFWIVNARDYTRTIVRKCVHCFRYKPKLLQQIMGDLPADRVNAALAFSTSGVDFCGPIWTSPTSRGHRKFKTYIAVFVCFISKGVHLEVVSDLSTNAFIAALKRFVGRRMLCRNLYCDNATNFVGAKKYLQELRDRFLNQATQKDIANWCAENSINFKHIPPRSPHFGGIWEAAVKSAKSLLYPTFQHAHLTYEELATVCCQIESILNSRPITEISTDPNDERALTPAHFWGQAPLDTILEPDVNKTSYLTKWQRISAIQHYFWNRWSKEYITSLQKRNKWQTQEPDVVTGKLVLIQEDNIPPQKWLLGRIVAAIPGKDNHVRVVDVRTKAGIFRRPIHRLALLPIENVEST